MYIPDAFRQEDLGDLHRLIEEYNFGLVISDDGERPLATSIPFMLHRDRGQFGTLVFHLARNNPQWQTLAGDKPILCIFQGPHSYVSADWYVDEGSVPTWNFMVVHTYGRARKLDDGEGTMWPMLKELVDHHENAERSSWDRAKAHRPDLMPHIVAFEMPIDRIEGQFKLNQNKSDRDRASVIAALERSEDTQRQAVAEAMRRY
ncbi:MAG: FMN-binding negative transcriptional regulator [Spirochaeta sp.]|jgi:transcriptional regulator|nr:FMN-binding negative transcriptional regulator [Spirochaeta sp.]